MLIKIPYGKDEKLNLNIDKQYVYAILEPNEVPIAEESETLLQAINNPINSQNLNEFLKDSKLTLIIVNDATRPTPTAKVLDIIYKDIKGFNVKFLIATGTHRAPTEEEYYQIFDKFHDIFKDRIYVHDSTLEAEMIYLGKSRHGTEMYVNKMALEADRIIIIGSVEPHYFAGYTGGRKALLPGIAAFKTIEQNHKLAILPSAKNLSLEGNPLHEDMVDFVESLKQNVFTISMVLDKHHRIYAVTSGNIHDSFTEAVKKANDVCVVKIREKADIVVSIIKYPMDIDLYQSHKGIENTKPALKENGILIMVSKCRFGVGKESFIKLAGSYNSVEELYKKIEKEYVLGYHKIGKLAEINQWAQVWAVTDLKPEILRKIFIKPFNSIQEAIDKAIALQGKKAKIVFFMDSSVTVPVIDNKDG